MTNMPKDLSVEDIEYVRHGERGFQLRLFRPLVGGPFPIVVDAHGGAWCDSDRTSAQMRGEILARGGMAVAALDFRHGPDGYPTSLQDINYGIRWLKENAARFNLDPTRVALGGASSGGHLAMLSAMRPADPRYAALKLDTKHDARVSCVGMIAPVINPLSRYRRTTAAKKLPNPPEWSINVPGKHDIYWKTEAAMSEGSPVLMLERGEKVEMPPVFYVQGLPDDNHVYQDPDSQTDKNEQERFVRLYKEKGGKIELVYVEEKEKQSPSLYVPLVGFYRAQFGL
jgi:acetyl esterase